MTADILQVRRDGDFSYPIIFRKDFSDLSAQLKRLGLTKRKFCIVTDSTVAPLYLNTVKKELERCAFFVTSYVLPAGEENKTLEQIQGIYQHLIEMHFDRRFELGKSGGYGGDCHL